VKPAGPLPNRTLIISPNWIGDAVMAQPLLQLLSKREGQGPIDILATPAIAPVWRAMAEVDTVLEVSFRHGALQWKERLACAKLLRQRGYRDAFVLPNTLKFALIPWLAGIPKRIGYRGEMRYGLLNVIHHEDSQARRPMVSFYAALARASKAPNLKVNDLPRPRLTVQPELIETVCKRYDVPRFALGQSADHAPLVVFAPGAEFGSAKQWPAAYFAELANIIFTQYAQAVIVLLGSAKDYPTCQQIVGDANATGRKINLAGKTSLNDAIALIAACSAVVSNDSGLLHIASGLNRPVVAIYGPTDPNHAPPFSDLAQSLFLALDCAPCRQRECPLGHHDCMRKITAGSVWQSLKPMIN
jgi:heptosyltransferase-2